MRLLLLGSLVAAALAAFVEPYAAYGYAKEDVLESVDISGDGGIVKHILKRGTGATPSAGNTVHAHYDGKLAEGAKPFDSSRKRGAPFSFPLGQGRVIKGWDMGFAGMAVGEKAILDITSEYGYGARGAGGVIPPGAQLYFEVELMSIDGKPAAEL